MIRFILYSLFAYFVYRIARSWLRSLSGAGSHETDETSPREAELIQDPQCGTYFLKQRGMTAQVGGQTVYFCSKTCRDAYLKVKGKP
jgi:YHS domain-containing protein